MQDLQDLDMQSSDSGPVLPPVVDSTSGRGSAVGSGSGLSYVLPTVVDPPLDVRLHRIEMALTMIVTRLMTIEGLLQGSRLP